jgi:glycine hydroxymethyltransferase
MSVLQKNDPQLYELMVAEEKRQRDKIRLIPSENYVSQSVLEATGSVLTNKYSEGYATKRYYEGQQYIDAIELLAIDRAKSLFNADHANVQPYSGSPANLAVLTAFCEPGDTIMGLSLPFGGHLTHGWKVSATGKLYKSVQYETRREDGRLDFDTIRELAKTHKPKVIITGATAYPREIDFKAFKSITDEVGARLVADIAHIAGLVAGGEHMSPVPYADVVTTTTHKTLRGPRGGMILCTEEVRKEIDRAVFPGLQGGPHNHTTAAIATALHEAAQPEFKTYAKQIRLNAAALAEHLVSKGYNLVTGGTDNHLLLIDLTNKDIPGKIAAQAMDKAGVVLNYNSVPFDQRKPFDPSGIRLGTPAVTTRGMKEAEMKHIAEWMDQAIKHPEDEQKLTHLAKEVAEFCSTFPVPGKQLID